MPLVSVEDFRRRAKRRLPRGVFDFIDGAAGCEATLRANTERYQRITFRPSPLDLSGVVDQSTTVLGRRVDTPVLLAPAGAARLVHRDAELVAARAALRLNTIFALSVASTRSLEEVAAAGDPAGMWFQVFLWRDRTILTPLLERAAAAGYGALCVTIDPGGGVMKYRDLRNGFANPPRVTVQAILEGMRHPRWAAGFAFGPSRGMAHLELGGSARPTSMLRGPKVLESRLKGGGTWDDLAWVRRQWHGPLVVKGVLTRETAAKAAKYGADAVVCSNHGGRNMDGNPASIDALPEVLEAVDGQGKEVYVDGGIRTGSDVVKALSIGARACLIGRPYFWGLAVAGQSGVVSIVQLLQDEVGCVMAMLGRATVPELDASAVNLRSS